MSVPGRPVRSAPMVPPAKKRLIAMREREDQQRIHEDLRRLRVEFLERDQRRHS